MHKPADELGIIAWSSHVCAYDLRRRRNAGGAARLAEPRAVLDRLGVRDLRHQQHRADRMGLPPVRQRRHRMAEYRPADHQLRRRLSLPDPEGKAAAGRSEERRVGKEWFTPCYSRWAPYQ